MTQIRVGKAPVCLSKAVKSLDYDHLGQGLSAAPALPASAATWQPGNDDHWPGHENLPGDHRWDPQTMARSIVRPLILVGGFAANGLARWVEHQGRKYLDQQVWPPYHFDPHSGDWRVHGADKLHTNHLLPTGLLAGQYEPLLLFLQQELGYRLGENLWIFPYRWTDSVESSGRRLAGWIKALGSPVDILSHSLGGQLARVAGLFYGAPIERVIYCACPFFGTGKAYFNLHPEHEARLVDNVWLNRLLNLVGDGHPDRQLTRCFQTMDSVYELLPDAIGFELGLSPVEQARSWPEAYLERAESAFPVELHERVVRAMDVKQRLGQQLPGSVSLILYSDSHRTPVRVERNLFGLVNEAALTGDGTLPALSSQGPGAAIRVHGRHLALVNHRLSFYWMARFLTSTAGMTKIRVTSSLSE